MTDSTIHQIDKDFIKELKENLVDDDGNDVEIAHQMDQDYIKELTNELTKQRDKLKNEMMKLNKQN